MLLSSGNIYKIAEQKQHQKSSASCEGLPLDAAAPHARETQECLGGNQTGPDRRRLQEEPRRFHPTGS
ncbi:hypothetical protein ATANTOWER_017892 [Ataeniobius toweri]|uniref:Uncharacterized protein n=1 Tax=Ataeniobius toweri TaxID=208326 RepID=A0ABU7C2I4_9TELE|nr:hypothetical protein [Ataeniobius toweri]